MTKDEQHQVEQALGQLPQLRGNIVALRTAFIALCLHITNSDAKELEQISKELDLLRPEVLEHLGDDSFAVLGYEHTIKRIRSVLIAEAGSG